MFVLMRIVKYMSVDVLSVDVLSADMLSSNSYEARSLTHNRKKGSVKVRRVKLLLRVVSVFPIEDVCVLVSYSCPLVSHKCEQTHKSRKQLRLPYTAHLH